MQQHSNSREFVPTIVTIDGVRQGVIGRGVRYVLTVGLLGVIFVSSMMLVIFAS